MKRMNSPQHYWQVDRVSAELKIHKLQEELERVTLENSRLLERSGVSEGKRKELKRWERMKGRGGRRKKQAVR